MHSIAYAAAMPTISKHAASGVPTGCLVGFGSKSWYSDSCGLKQEVQLSQRDRATLCLLNILLSHSRSLKVIRNDTVE